MKRVHLNGLLLIDCPASALNNSKDMENKRTDNTSATKYIKTYQGSFPYLSAQAFRYWLRDSFPEIEKSPIERTEKSAYTKADPISYAEDDLFGYMRAEKNEKNKKDVKNESDEKKDEKNKTLTRSSPLKVSTFVSIVPIKPTADFGVMARHEGDPVPYEHEFYRTTLKGLISLDLSMVGRFYHIAKAGYKNLDEDRVKQANEKKLEAYDNEKAYQLSKEERTRRIKLIIEALKDITGGAKQSIHYTDVNPKFVLLGVIKSGNNIFSNVVSSDSYGLPKINFDALKEVLNVFKDDILSKIYIGLPQGYLDSQREKLENVFKENKFDYILNHPKVIMEEFIKDLESSEKQNSWLE
ncbi:MAG: type I-B CRISPR-associated protein Cas7/Cst2/DevR [Candidatus Sericytochromatia bacterium]